MTPFSLGILLATPGAIEASEKAHDDLAKYIRRHSQNDWGELDDFDRRMNEEALVVGNRLLSSYRLKDETRIWIITEADRSVTTVLLPSEY